jgi:Prokaryotic Cytochrome C oxidase subunit IV
MTEVLRDRVTIVWAVLMGATIVSWWLGTDHAVTDARLASALVLLVALVKVRFIGAYFMELRDAPGVLKVLFQGWCIAVYTVLVGMFLIL